jgi:hypothetical protein
MFKGILIFACVLTLQGATVARMACGGPGGTDAAGNVWTADSKAGGGAAWTVANQPALSSQPIPYQALCYSLGTVQFSRTFTVPAGNYSVILKFLEPNKTAAGQRTFVISLNGSPVTLGLDVFAAAGALKPYDRAFAISAPGGFIQVTLAGAIGNAVLSAVQIDEAAPNQPTGGMICQTGKVISTQLPVGQKDFQIPISTVVSGDFRYDHVMVSETSRFDTPSITVSMGRPANSDELTGALVPLGISNGDVNTWYARPVPPQIFGLYDVVLAFQTASPAGFSQATGILKWEICGYSAAPTAATLTGLAICTGSGSATWTDDKGLVHQSTSSCDGLMRAQITLTNGATVNLTGADLPSIPSTYANWSPIPVK